MVISQSSFIKMTIRLVFFMCLLIVLGNAGESSAAPADMGWKEGKMAFTYYFANGPEEFDIQDAVDPRYDITDFRAKIAMRAALKEWQDVLSISLTEVSDRASADLVLRWGEIDGPANVPGIPNYLAIANRSINITGSRYTTKCAITFDAAEQWTVRIPSSSNQINLKLIAMHEMGHCLGLIEHVAGDPESIMQEQYNDFYTLRDLGANDIARAHALHTPAPIVGSVTTNQANRNQWHTVTFDYAYLEPPIVMLSPVSSNEGHQTTTRVRNVTTTSFQFQLDEWDYLDGAHAQETVYYMVVPEGTHNWGEFSYYAGWGDLQVTAGSATLNHEWETISLADTFVGTPVVFAQQATSNDRNGTTVRTRNVTGSSFELRLQEEQGTENASHADETVHYIVMEQGEGFASGIDFSVNLTDNSVTHDNHELSRPIRAGFAWNNFHFFADDQTFNDSDTAAVRYYVGERHTLNVKMEEEKSGDTEVNHAQEQIGWLTFGKATD